MSIINSQSETITKQTSITVVQAEEPIQQKREILPISSARSLFCKGQFKHLVSFQSNFKQLPCWKWLRKKIYIPCTLLFSQAIQFDPGIKMSTTTHSWTAKTTYKGIDRTWQLLKPIFSFTANIVLPFLVKWEEEESLWKVERWERASHWQTTKSREKDLIWNIKESIEIVASCNKQENLNRTLKSRKTFRARLVDLSTFCAVPGCPLLKNLEPYWIALQILSLASALFRYKTSKASSALVASNVLILLTSDLIAQSWKKTKT